VRLIKTPVLKQRAFYTYFFFSVFYIVITEATTVADADKLSLDVVSNRNPDSIIKIGRSKSNYKFACLNLAI